jgi:hypothetical protein
MKPEPYLDALGIPLPSPESGQAFAELIPKIIDQIGRRFAAPHPIFPQELQDIIFLSLSFHSPDEWKTKFSRAAKSAIQFSPTIERLYKTIEAGLLTPEVAKAYKKINPAFNPDPVIVRPMPTPAPQKITPPAATTPKKKTKSNRGESWKPHRSEKKLWRSSKVSFDHLLYRAQVPKDPEKFPWCQVGIKSLIKFTGYSHPQVTRALAQLQRFKRIKRIFEGNKFQGASKYLVFFTPQMSRAHSYKSRHAKRD